MPHRIICSGEMADLTRRFPWETTSLGPIQHWPDELITTVNLLLASKCPMLLWWGPELVQFYNDAYSHCIREDKHPSALGQCGEQCWQEIWPIISLEIDRVVKYGESTWSADRSVPIFRNGQMEEVFWTYSYSPVRDRKGRRIGVLVVCNETTEQVLNERRLRTLLTIETKHPGNPTADELAHHLLQALASNPADIPLALLYAVEENHVEGSKVRLLAHHGLPSDIEIPPDRLPILEVAASKTPVRVDDFADRVGKLVCEPWPEALQTVYVQPVGAGIRQLYVLVLGISPRLPFDSNYASFFQLVGNRVCGLLENEAHQEERSLAETQRTKLFETVDQQRELLTNIVESAPAGIAVLDNALRLKWCNPYFTSFFGSEWRSRNLLGLGIRELVLHADEVTRILEGVRDTGEPFTATEYAHLGRAGGMAYWCWSAVRLVTGEILIVASEVTEQVAARHKLEAVGERLHLAQKAARLGTFYWHLPSGKVEWSPEFYDATGFDPAVKADWQVYLRQVHPRDRDLLQQELATVADRGVLQIHDHRLTDGNGQERWAALTGHVHANSSGTAERIIGTVADITERKRAEKALEESKKDAQQQWAELEAIYRTAPIALALFDPLEFRYLRLNSRQAEMVGLPPEQILGKTLTEIVPIDGLREMFQQVANGKPVSNALLEGELPMSPGEHRYWTVNFFPVYDANGSIQAISAASLEITAQKRAELALIQNEKIAAVGRLASSISHEINNPLAAVTNLLFLMRDEELSPTGQEYLATAERELARVSQIATHTLRFHRQSTKATETGAADMIDPILALHQGRITSSAIKIKKEYRTETKVLCFDGEIRQVLNNLIGNAMDEMWHGGSLMLRSQMATDWQSGRKGLRITIADTGRGMNEVTKRRLFEAFFTTKGIKGTGLGLWISAEIVRKHGGRLRFRSSRKEGRSGTVFQLLLPLEPVFVEKKEPVRTQSQ